MKDLLIHKTTLDKEIADLEKHGFKVVIEPKPAVAFGGRKVVFMMNIGFGLMEILETEG